MTRGFKIRQNLVDCCTKLAQDTVEAAELLSVDCNTYK